MLEYHVPDKIKIGDHHHLIVANRNINNLPDLVFQEAAEKGCTIINLSENKFRTVPDGLTYVARRARVINLCNNLLNNIPNWISEFYLLSRLDLSGNYLSSLPADLSQLINLKYFDISQNKFTELPSTIYALTALEVLHAYGNQIRGIDVGPNGLGNLKKLCVLNLANNNISEIPLALGYLENIKYLELYGNCFRHPRYQILEKGTSAVMAYLRDRMT